MERSYILHLKDGAKIVTESEAIRNALKQEKEGVQPRYAFHDYKTGQNLTAPGVACMVNVCGRLRGCIS